MTFKKNLRIQSSCKGQATLEYFILIAVIALLTILSLTTFHTNIANLTQGEVDSQGNVIRNGFFQAAVGEDGLNVENNATIIQ